VFFRASDETVPMGETNVPAFCAGSSHHAQEGSPSQVSSSVGVGRLVDEGAWSPRINRPRGRPAVIRRQGRRGHQRVFQRKSHEGGSHLRSPELSATGSTGRPVVRGATRVENRWNHQPFFKNPSKRWWRRRELKPGWAVRVSARRCDKKPVFIGRNALSLVRARFSKTAPKRTKMQKICHQLSSILGA